MTTTTAAQPGSETAVEQAEQEATEAEQLLTALEERVREGDDEITPDQLSNARELGRFAKLRADAARRKAERTTAKAAEQERAAHLDQATALAAPGGPLDADALAITYATARAAVRAFITASETYNTTTGQGARLLAAAGVPDSTFGPTPEPGTAARWGTDRFRLADGSTYYPTGTGLRLAVLLDDLNTEFHDIPTGAFHPPFVRTPISDQATRGRDGHPQLHVLAAEQAGGAK
ncbi:hypothetical protein [Streptomyces sp. NPDC051561]|uniref:hypothetical protein n=1 Tax=Streptomyces sp. NPDC051561 TaxID=3365658 RepID=UPI00379FF860